MDRIDAVKRLSALAQDTRLDLFRLLVKAGPEGQAAGDIARALGNAPNTTSAQLPLVPLLRARAIENQCYVVGVNRVGADGLNVPYAGDSVAVDYLGRPLLELGEQSAVGSVSLDSAPLAVFRERFPAHLDADRFDLDLQ
jgi:predicted amidohydrolase